MSNLFVTGTSGLQAFQRALEATSQNIANSNTEGYVRQRADFSTREPSLVGDMWIGTGVEVGRLRRVANDFLADQSRTARSASARLDLFASQSARVANLLGGASNGLTASLQRLQNAFEGVATEPGSIPARQVLLGELQATVSQFRSTDTRLREFESETNGQLASEVSDLDSLASGIAALNREVAAARATSGGVPNDLLDARDRLLDQLAEKVSVRFVAADGGAVNVFIGRGQSLVLGEVAARIGLQQDPTDGTRQRIVLRSDGSSVDITPALAGGKLGGLLDFRGQVLDPARNELGRLAATLADTLNAQHGEGIDLLGAAGGDLLAVGGPQALVPATNAGSVTASVALTDVPALTGSDYQLEYSGSAWSARRLDTGATVSVSGAGTALSPLQVDGLSVQIGGTAVAGDRVVLRPTREVIQDLASLLSSPAKVAAASPVAARAAGGNAGTLAIGGLEVLDATQPALRATVTLAFPTAGTVSVDGGTPEPWSSGQVIERNGWRLVLSGTPAAGDQVTVADNAGAVGDNRNAIRLADALRSPQLDSRTLSLTEASTRLVSGVGAATQQAQRNLEVQRIAYGESVRQRQSISGVNLDEEAANLLRFQQAYQASAQVIRAANEVFRMLIDVTR